MLAENISHGCVELLKRNSAVCVYSLYRLVRLKINNALFSLHTVRKEKENMQLNH